MEKATRKRDSAKPTGVAAQQDLLRQLVQRRRGVMEADMEEAVAAEKAREDGAIRSKAGVMAIGVDREGRRKLLAGELFGANSTAVGRIFELPSVAAAVLLLGEPLGPLNFALTTIRRTSKPVLKGKHAIFKQRPNHPCW